MNATPATIDAQGVAVRPDVLPASQSETAAVLSMIERLAKDPAVDMNRVERMMVLRREVHMEQAREAFNHAMAAVQRELPQVTRDARNTHTNSNYARLETIGRAIDPFISKHGIALSYGVEKVDGELFVFCDVSLGIYEKRIHMPTPLDKSGSQGKSNKTEIQALGSSISYARRYLKLMIFDIALTNEDNDGNRVVDERVGASVQDERPQIAAKSEPQRITADQAKQIRDAIKFVGETETNFCIATKIKAIETIYADDFHAALKFIRSAGGSNAGRR